MDINDFFDASLDSAKKRVGDSGQLFVEDAVEESQRGLAFPGLALPYLFFSRILPFGKILGLAGFKASFKSAFGFWLGALAMSRGGGYHLVETEGKLNEKFMKSFHPKELEGRRHVDYARTLEEAQDCVTAVVERYKASKVRNPFPLVLGIDSLAGNDTQNNYDKIRKEGHAQRAYAEAALLWSPYFKKLSSDLVGLDILVYFTNHLKPKTQDGPGFAKTYSKQGGSSQDFHAAQYIYFTKIANIDLVSKEGKLVQLHAEKCGLGPDNRKIQVPITWRHELNEDGEPEQISKWDWDSATAKLLAEGSKVILPKRIQSQLDVKCSANRYSSERLGLKNVEDFELGQAVDADEEYKEFFRKLVGYSRWTEIGS